MKYLIDGYNLLFRLLHKGKAVKEAREEMIESMSKKVNFIHLPITLVFDSGFQPGWASSKIDGDLEVLYTNEGETADEWLIRYVKNLGAEDQVTIVTSDNRLKVHLLRKGVKLLTSEEFMRFLNSRVRTIIKQMRDDKVPKKKPALPEKRVAKGSLEYYEALFQERLGEEPEGESQIKRPSESEEDRWKRLFSE